MTAPSGKSVEYDVHVFHIADGKVTETWGMAENDAETDPSGHEFASTTGSTSTGLERRVLGWGSPAHLRRDWTIHRDHLGRPPDVHGPP